MGRGCLALFLSLTAGTAFTQAQVPAAPANLPPTPVPIGAPAPVLAPATGAGPATAGTGAAPVPFPTVQGTVVPVSAPPPAPQTPGSALSPYPLPPPYEIPPPAPPGAVSVIEDGRSSPWVSDPDRVPRLWIQSDFLLWFIRNGPLNVPLATTGSASDANPGALGQPHTQVLFGDSSLNYGANPGGALNVGGWFDSECRFGMEGGFFALSQQQVGFSAFSNSAGSPVLSVPFFNVQTLKEDQAPVALPGILSGGIIVASTSCLTGANLDGSFNLVRGSGFNVDLLAGFRFLDLREDLNIQTPDIDISSAGGGGSFNTVDEFRTSNQFYGGQLGARIGYRWERLSVDLTGSVALGSTYQSLNIDGFSLATTGPGAAPQYYPGGIFAQPTNMAHYWAWDFAVVPEAQLKIGFQVWRNLQLTAGYNFLYWSSVARPGAQLDRDINPSQSVLLGTGALTGPAQPTAPLTRSDLFANGLTVGFDLHW